MLEKSHTFLTGDGNVTWTCQRGVPYSNILQMVSNYLQCLSNLLFFLFMSVTLCLSGDLHLRFSRFVSTKQSWIWSICKAVHSSVRGCRFQCSLTLWPHRCTQFSCPAICAEQQLLVDWSFHHNAMHMICCQRAQRPFSYQLSTTCPIYFRLFFQAFESSQVSGCGR